MRPDIVIETGGSPILLAGRCRFEIGNTAEIESIQRFIRNTVDWRSASRLAKNVIHRYGSSAYHFGER